MFFIKDGKLCPFFLGEPAPYPAYYKSRYYRVNNTLLYGNLPPPSFARYYDSRNTFNKLYDNPTVVSSNNYYFDNYYWDNANYMEDSTHRWAYARYYSQITMIEESLYSSSKYPFSQSHKTDDKFSFSSGTIGVMQTNKIGTNIIYSIPYGLGITYENGSLYGKTTDNCISITKSGYIFIILFASIVQVTIKGDVQTSGDCYIADNFNSNDHVDILINGTTLGSANSNSSYTSVNIRNLCGLNISSLSSSDDRRIKSTYSRPTIVDDITSFSHYYGETKGRDIFKRIPNLYIGRFRVTKGTKIKICMNAQRTISAPRWYELYFSSVYFCIT